MKTMTCKQLGGACNTAFHTNSFDEIAELSRKHGLEMFQKGWLSTDIPARNLSNNFAANYCLQSARPMSLPKQD